MPLLEASPPQSQLPSLDLHHPQLNVKGSTSSSAAAAQSGVSLPLLFSFAALPPCLSDKGSSSVEVGGLLYSERAAVAGCRTALSDCMRQQLEAESDLLAILLEILKNNKAFRHFATCQLRQLRDKEKEEGGGRDGETTPSRGERERERRRERGLISRLCLRLLLNDTDRDSWWNLSGPGSPGQCVLRAKLQVRTIQYGTVQYSTMQYSKSSAFEFPHSSNLRMRTFPSLIRWSDFYPV
jgi:hypothetical protein